MKFDETSLAVVDPKTGKTYRWTHPEKVNQILADYDIDGVPFKIYGSRIRTFDEALKRLYDRRELVRCYHFLTADTRLDLPLNACRDVVLGEIARIWYEVSGREVPPEVTQKQEERMAKAKNTSAEAEQQAAAGEAVTKEPRITNRSIIENGLLAGQSNEEIMKAVKARFPDGRADDKHIGYYRHFLVKAGKLEKQPRQPRAKKEKATAGAEEAAPAKVSAKAGVAKTARPAGGAVPKPGREAKSTAKAGR